MTTKISSLFKFIFATALSLVLLLSFSVIPNTTAYGDNKNKTDAKKPIPAYCVMDMDTGTILVSSNENHQQGIASLTKVVTAITVLENMEYLEKKYCVPKSATLVEGSSIYLQKGEPISVKELLYGLMLRSGNDSAHMLSQIIGGSNEGFGELMNETAIIAGATDSNFTNPHGLDEINHYSTASDLCKITSYAMKNPTFSKISGSKKYQGERTTYFNKNKMLNLYDGATGGKTGYTKKCGRCLITTATREGKNLVCVVLNQPDMWTLSSSLLDQGFTKK